MNGVKSFLKLCFQIFSSTLGGCWLIIEILSTIFPGKIHIQGNPLYLLTPTVIISVVYIKWTIFHITYKVGEFDRKVEIRLGNMLRKKNGTIVIGTNNDLSTNLNRVGSDSLQTQVTKLIGQEAIDAQFIIAKKKFSVAADEKYPYGLSFESRAHKKSLLPLAQEAHSFLYIIMSSLTAGRNAYTTQMQLTEAINQLFHQAKNFDIKNSTIYCPLLGTGTANVDLNKQAVAKILISQYIANCGENGCNIKKFVLYIRWKDLQYINLIELRRICEQMTAACSSCPEKNLQWFQERRKRLEAETR